MAYYYSIWRNYCYPFCKLATGFIHLKEQDVEVDPNLLDSNSLCSDQLASLNGQWVGQVNLGTRGVGVEDGLLLT